MRLSPRPARPARAAAAPALLAALGLAVLGLSGCTADERSTGQVTPSASASSDAPSTPSSTPADEPTPTATPSASPTGVAVGEVVPGFPLDVVPVLPEAEVALSNVVEQDGGGRTVALAGRTTRTAEEVVAFYTEALTAQGFTATAPPAVEGAVVTTFSRGTAAADLLTLSVTSAAGLQDFSIGGQLA